MENQNFTSTGQDVNFVLAQHNLASLQQAVNAVQVPASIGANSPVPWTIKNVNKYKSHRCLSLQGTQTLLQFVIIFIFTCVCGNNYTSRMNKSVWSVASRVQLQLTRLLLRESAFPTKKKKSDSDGYSHVQSTSGISQATDFRSAKRNGKLKVTETSPNVGELYKGLDNNNIILIL